jgi:hypothetical protein
MTRPSLAGVEDLLAGQAAALLSGADLRGKLRGADPDGQALAALRAAWDELPRDEHLADRGTWRQRRYGRLLATPEAGAGATGAGGRHRLSALPDEAFQQAAELIPLYQGKARRFAPVRPGTLASPALLALVGHDLDLVTRVEGGGPRRAVVGLHLIRVLADGGRGVAPAPEGRHSDGHAWIAMHQIGRHDCTGGTSSVYRPGEDSPFLVTTMQEALDTVVVDDRRVEHEVSPIRAAGRGGRRDILLVDIDFDIDTTED